MRKRLCTCGAEADVRRGTRRTADGRDEIVYRMTCPVCGQLGPAIAAPGTTEPSQLRKAPKTRGFHNGAVWSSFPSMLSPAHYGLKIRWRPDEVNPRECEISYLVGPGGHRGSPASGSGKSPESPNRGRRRSSNGLGISQLEKSL